MTRKGKWPIPLYPAREGNEQELVQKVLRGEQLYIFAKIAMEKRPANPVFDFVMRGSLLVPIVKEELGIDIDKELHIPQRIHTYISAFMGRLIANMDTHFDTNRGKYRIALSTGGLLEALLSAPVHENGVKCTVKDMLDIVKVLISDSRIYTKKEDRELVTLALKNIIEGATEVMTEVEGQPGKVGIKTAQRLKDTTNKLLAELLFDLEFVPLRSRQGYKKARDRVVAGWQATQYIDDLDDIAEDLLLSGVTMLIAFAKEYGEYDILQDSRETLSALQLDDKRRYIYGIAPHSYRRLYELQEEKLRVVSNARFKYLQGIPCFWC